MTDDITLAGFAESVAAATPAPAGGSVAAVCAALAAALTAMVGRVAQAKAGGPDNAGLADLIESADRARGRLLELAGEDARAFEAVIVARRSTAGTDLDRAERLAKAWRKAARVPSDVVLLSRQVAQLAKRAAREGPASTLGDAVMAALVAAATAAGSMINLRLNVQAAGSPPDLRVLVDQSEVILRETQHAAADTRLAAEERLTGGGAKSGGPAE
jgi:glutamate formiminotransferase/formiminotetrahydrofolate cyclodeaminase